jgi:hypothetical protein
MASNVHEGILCVGRDSPGSDPLGVIAVKGVVNIITRSNHWPVKKRPRRGQ